MLNNYFVRGLLQRVSGHVTIAASLSSPPFYHLSRLYSLSRSQPQLPSHLKSLKMSPHRQISLTAPCQNYEGDGKTTVTILNHEIDSPLMVDTYHANGFSLNNGFAVRGPMALFPKTVLAWDVGSPEQITPDSLALFTVLEPKLDILIIGVGDPGNQHKIPVDVIKMLKRKKINFEILPTDHASSTFNFLNIERRCVAAALLPPKTITKVVPEDMLRSKIARRRMIEEDELKI